MDTINLKLEDIRNSLAALNKLAVRDDLPFKFNFKIAKLSMEILPIVRIYETSLNKFVTENKASVESGNYVFKNEKSRDNFHKQHQEILESEYPINVEKITLKEAEAYKLNAEQIRFLFWMIQE